MFIFIFEIPFLTMSTNTFPPHPVFSSSNPNPPQNFFDSEEIQEYWRNQDVPQGNVVHSVNGKEEEEQQAAEKNEQVANEEDSAITQKKKWGIVMITSLLHFIQLCGKSIYLLICWLIKFVESEIESWQEKLGCAKNTFLRWWLSALSYICPGPCQQVMSNLAYVLTFHVFCGHVLFSYIACLPHSPCRNKFKIWSKRIRTWSPW